MLSSCKNNMMEMLSQTNSNFTAKEEPYDQSLNPGDEGFKEEYMLQNDYYVGNRMSLCVTAPLAESYYWSMHRLEKEESASWVGADSVKTAEFEFPSGVDQYSRSFTFYVPELPDLKLGTYLLVLKIRGKDGNEYQDTAEVVIYDQFFIELL